MPDNLALWHMVEKTDPKQVKVITGKPYSGSSPKPYWLVQRATETFGPCGIGWGFEIVEDKLLDGALIEPGFYERIHMARVAVWYKYNGERGEVEHVGQTAFCGLRRDGKKYTDEDAPKKSVTDALIKALSMIGFAGDIFMGRFDDSKYVQEVGKEFAEQAKQQAAAEQPMIARYIEQSHRIISGCNNTEPLKKWWSNETCVREDMGIIRGTPEFIDLYDAFVARGKALSANSHVERSVA